MAANLDMIKGTAVAILAVIGAVVNVAANVSVCFHIKNLLFVLILFLTEEKVLFKGKTFYFIFSKHRI